MIAVRLHVSPLDVIEWDPWMFGAVLDVLNGSNPASLDAGLEALRGMKS